MKYIKFNLREIPRIMYAHKCTIDNVNGCKRKNTYYEFTYVFDGEMVITIDSQKFVVGKNQFFMSPCGVEFEIKLNKKLTHSCFAFFLDKECPIVDEKDIMFSISDNKVMIEIEPLYVPLFGEITNSSILDLLNKITSTQKIKQEYKNLIIGSETIEFLSTIAYIKEENTKTRAGDKYTQLVNNYISLNYADPNTNINEISNKIGICPNYLCNIYKKETGTTINARLIETRIEKAKSLLLLNKYRIKDIAELVGFVDANYFSIFFKKYVGVTPKEYIREK